MKIIILVIIVIIIGIVESTTIIIKNTCGEPVSVWETRAANSVGGAGSSQVCYLGAQQSCTRTYGTGYIFNLKGGQFGKTLAEFNIAQRDWYDVSRVVGYDYPIMIVQPNDGTPNCQVAMCNYNACHGPLAYGWSNDDTATHDCATGKTFTVQFCGF